MHRPAQMCSASFPLFNIKNDSHKVLMHGTSFFALSSLARWRRNLSPLLLDGCMKVNEPLLATSRCGIKMMMRSSIVCIIHHACTPLTFFFRGSLSLSLSLSQPTSGFIGVLWENRWPCRMMKQPGQPGIAIYSLPKQPKRTPMGVLL